LINSGVADDPAMIDHCHRMSKQIGHSEKILAYLLRNTNPLNQYLNLYSQRQVALVAKPDPAES